MMHKIHTCSNRVVLVILPASLSVLFPLDPGMSRAIHPQVFSKVDVEH